MSKSSDWNVDDFEQPDAEGKTRRGLSLIAMMLILSIVGLAIWFVVNHEEASQ